MKKKYIILIIIAILIVIAIATVCIYNGSRNQAKGYKIEQVKQYNYFIVKEESRIWSN